MQGIVHSIRDSDGPDCIIFMFSFSQGVSEAVVSSVQDLSPTVKHLILQVDNSQVSFKAGQW